MGLIGRGGGRPYKISSSMRGMQEVRRPSRHPDTSGDLTGFFEEINSLPLQRVGSQELAYILHMATDPSFVNYPVRVRSGR